MPTEDDSILKVAYENTFQELVDYKPVAYKKTNCSQADNVVPPLYIEHAYNTYIHRHNLFGRRLLCKQHELLSTANFNIIYKEVKRSVYEQTAETSSKMLVFFLMNV